MPLFRRKPDPPARGREAQREGETLAVSQRQLSYAEQMGAFVEDAMSLKDAMAARVHSEDVDHG